MNYLVYIILISILIVGRAFACYSVSDELKPSAEQLVGKSKNIFLAEVTNISSAMKNIKGSKTFYSFKIIEVLKGSSKSTIQIAASYAENIESDFDMHKKKEFWTDNSFGRVNITPACEILPSFSIGKRYLLFPDEPFTFKSFELIETEKDMFLSKVRELLKKKNKK